MRNKPKPRSGLTLVETLVALCMFSLFGLAATASLTLALRHWGLVATQVNATQSARFVTGLIANELRQGLPNPHPSLGYPGRGLPPTALLLPHENQVQTGELVFTEPNAARYDPLDPAWDPTSAESYKQIRYYVRDGNTRIVREETSYSASGGASTTEEVVAHGDFLALQFDWRSRNMVDVSIRVREGETSEYNKDVSYVTRCYILGR